MSRALQFIPVALALISCTTAVPDATQPEERGDQSTERGERPNIVLIISDDQHYRDFGFMGSTVAKTPNLDRLARGGTVFPNGYSTSSICRPALASLLTGLYPHQWRFRVQGLLRSGTISDDRFAFVDFATLPRILSDAGYATFQTGKYWEGTYEMSGFTEGMTDELGEEGYYGRSGGAALQIVRETMDPVYEFIDSHQDEPFFIWLSPLLPHRPHNPPKKYRDLYNDVEIDPADLGYYGNIARLDEGVGALIDYIESHELASDTLFVFVVDNGWTNGKSPLGGPGGKGSLHEAGFRTPIVFNWRGRVPGGAINDSLVSIVDLFPTLLAYAEAPIPEARPGFNMRPAIEEGTNPVREFIVGNQIVRTMAEGKPMSITSRFIRNERYHLFLSGVGRIPNLYDIKNDPDEENNLASQEKALVNAFRETMRDQLVLDLEMMRD